jgi:hypothetical protein
MSTTASPREERDHPGSGPKFHLNIEGVNHDWDQATIAVAQIRALGNLPSDTPVEEVDLTTNTQRTLREDEVVELRPGLGFAKKVKFQRG